MLGNLPSGYNKAVHGPYDPAVFYGKADLPLSQVIIWFIFIFIVLIIECSGEGLPAPCLARSPTVLQSHCLRAGSVQVESIMDSVFRYIYCFITRAYWRWNHKYCLPKHCGITPFVQMSVGFSALFYIMNYGGISEHKNHKYHW